jgi:pseudouridine synthase
MRLQKYLSRAGVASRREGERLIEDGRVTIDGAVVTELGTRVVPGEQEVRVDGRPAELSPERWILMYKPVDTITSRSDEFGRRTVYSLLPEELHELFHVGRLDRMTEGLLILTNAGDAAHRLLHPSWEVPRRYRVEVDGEVGEQIVRRLEVGVELEDGPATAEEVRVAPTNDGHLLELTLREGRKREVRRLMAALGLEVRRLTRLSFGPIELGDELEPGEWRDLTAGEIRALRAAVEGEVSNGDS